MFDTFDLQVKEVAENVTTAGALSSEVSTFSPFVSATSNRTICGAVVEENVQIFPGLADQASGDKGWELTLISVYLLLGVLAIVGNLLIIVSVAAVRSLRRPTNYFIASLAVSDLLIGIGITTDCVLYPFWGHMCRNAYQICLGLTTLNNIAMAASPLNLMAIAYDRYKYITSPLTYYTDMGNVKVWGLILIAWIYAIMIGLAPIFPGDLANVPQEGSVHKSCLVYKVYPKLYLFFLIYGHLYVSFVITCVFYAQIFRKALQQSRKIRRLSVGSQRLEMERLSRRQAVLKSAAWRVTKMSAIVIVSVFVLWCPLTSLITYLILCDNCSVQYSVYAVTYILFYLNSCNNMFIYAWRSQEFRKAFKCVLKCGRR